MPYRTKNDVKSLGNSEYEDSGSYGSIDMSTMEQDRRERCRDHGWVTPTGELTEEGKCIVARFADLDAPEEVLNEEGVNKFMERAMGEYDPSANLTDEDFHGLEVFAPTSDNIPDSHGDYVERDYLGDLTDIDIMCQAIKNGNHLILKGPPGTGKTYAGKYIAQSRNQGVRKMNFSSDVKMTRLLGHLEVSGDGQGGTDTTKIYGEFSKAVRDGDMFIANEANMVTGDILSLFNSAVEKGNDSMTIPEFGESIPIHEDFTLVVTMNPRHAGTKRLNQAFSSRFQHLNFNYPNLKQEIEIVSKHVDVEPMRSELERVIDVVHDLREDYKSGEIPEPITPRETVRIAEYIRDGFTGPKEALKLALEKLPPEYRAPSQKKVETTLGT